VSRAAGERVLLPAVRAAADTDRRRRLQLSHPDRPGDRSDAVAPGPGACLSAATAV